MKSQRFLMSAGAFLIYVLLLFVSSQYIFSPDAYTGASSWIIFGFSALASLVFLSVGVFVWFFARDRVIAFWLFCFCFAMMTFLAVDIGSVLASDVCFVIIRDDSFLAAFICACILLAIFPGHEMQEDGRCFFSVTQTKAVVSHIYLRGAYVVLYVIGAIGCVLLVVSSWIHLTLPQASGNLSIWINSYTILGLIVCLVPGSILYFQTSSIRVRQQISLFVGSVVVCVLSSFLLIIILDMQHLLFLDGRLTAITLCFSPLALGYSILRYQILIFDSHVRKAVSCVVGVIFIFILVYIISALCNLFLYHFFGLHINFYIMFVVCIAALIAPLAWWLAWFVTERLFFKEMLHYRRLLEEPVIVADEMLDVSDVVALITSAAIHTFETSQVCVFVLSESDSVFNLLPKVSGEQLPAPVYSLLLSLQRALGVIEADEKDVLDYLDGRLPAIQRLAQSRRPLLLSEAIVASEDNLSRLHCYLRADSPLEDEDCMLAPIRAQGRMIGILVLGARITYGVHQAYAGPDLEAAQLLLARFSSVLESVRLYARTNQHVMLLNHLYNEAMMPGYSFNTVEDVMRIYAQAVARATSSAAEMWLYTEECKQLHLVAIAGVGPRLTTLDCLYAVHERDWSPCFFPGEQTEGIEPVSGVFPRIPPCLQQTPTCPFVWLPMHKEEKYIGILVITYERFRNYSKEEVRVLEMFANRCFFVLEHVRMTTELVSAYERQKELDQLKDQFIMTASHELRTPLTAVLGYIELLDQHHEQLSPEIRQDFIEKARHGCDELALLVGNIMDASRVDIDGYNSLLRSVSLSNTIQHVLELLEVTFTQEQREVTAQVDEQIHVIVDDMWLRQILLNLLSNALKYSSAGTPIKIDVQVDHQRQEVVIQIRDYGLGIPLEEQGQLFERFYRLKRDINSPVRGAGLGLFVCRQLLEAMKGRIWVESTGSPGEGCTFLFTLHLACDDHASPAAYATHQLPA